VANQRKAFDSLLFPFLFVGILWVIKGIEIFFHYNFSRFGIVPRTGVGLLGILTGPLIHVNLVHLFSNSLPLLILGIIVFNFYRKIAFEIFVWVYLISGLCVWIVGHDATSHIGASGLIYGFAGFIFCSGLFRHEFKAIMLAILVAVVYGSIIWGLFPGQTGISWQAHLYGAMTGALGAFFYRKEN
jgi:membrane associated rhomboid family serine protease